MHCLKFGLSSYIVVLGITLMSSFASFALDKAESSDQNLSSDTVCKKLLLSAENNINLDIYDQCGFGDETHAWSVWAPFASAKGLKRALFELCRRYPNYEYGPLYCQKAVDTGYGPALAYHGFKMLENGDEEKALSFFTQALKSGEITDFDRTHITESLGELYLTSKSNVYNPQTGLSLLYKASKERSALANNTLGYLYFSGKVGKAPSMRDAFMYFWRAILLGCPAAEENLGAFHLSQNDKISRQEALSYISKRAFSCTVPKDVANEKIVNHKEEKKLDCPCKDILERENFFRSVPYLYLEFDDEKKEANLQKSDGSSIWVRKGTALDDNAYVYEIRERAVILLQNGSRVIINRYHEGECVDYCLKPKDKSPKSESVQIRPYHLVFSERECADLMYYAPYLVDTTLPYVGKEECAHYKQGEKNRDELADLLLKEPEEVKTEDNSEDEIKKALEQAQKAVGIKRILKNGGKI